MDSSYRIGTGIAEVTDPAVGLPMQGMADQNQVTSGVESPLYARAFVVADSQDGRQARCVAIIVADIWAGTRRLKDAVLARLAATHGDLYAEENVLLAGTHTHSAPGGYSGHLLYDFDFERGGATMPIASGAPPRPTSASVRAWSRPSENIIRAETLGIHSTNVASNRQPSGLITTIRTSTAIIATTPATNGTTTDDTHRHPGRRLGERSAGI